VSPEQTHRFVDELLGDDLHAKRVLSLGNGVVGVMHAAALSVHAIGQGLAAANGTNPRHGVKQVDRLLSNRGIDVWELFAAWVPFVVADRREIVVALDWTDFDGDGQSTIALHMITRHGRASPLVWKSAPKKTITDGERNDLEDEVLMRLHEVLPENVKVTVLADRGFGDIKLYEYLDRIGWRYVIRFRGCIQVTDESGASKPAKEWLHGTGRARMIRNAAVTAKQYPTHVVCVRAKAMKDAWILATNRGDMTATQVVKLYGRRFSIEETFRDLKDPRYGFGLDSARVGRPDRRDKLVLLFAITHALLTLLGAASEATGLDRMLKVNTVKKRTHSLFRQGAFWFSAIPNMPEERLCMLMEAFEKIVADHTVFTEIFGVI
jgi:Transposase DDE domain